MIPLAHSCPSSDSSGVTSDLPQSDWGQNKAYIVEDASQERVLIAV